MATHQFDFARGIAIDAESSAWSFFPPPNWREPPKWLSFDFRVKYPAFFKLLSDTYDAGNREANILCAMGIRTCFDVAAEILEIDSGFSFSRKIEAMRKDGHISPREKDVLSILVDVGSAAAHRGWNPSRENISLLFDALETFIHHVLVLPLELDVLKEKVPKREVP